jgi:hypothetical protein
LNGAGPAAGWGMIESGMNITDIDHAIQLALAPVFLLTGIAGLLNVMTGRLARIIDRGRQFAEGKVRMIAGADTLRVELLNLERRRRLASWAINSCTFAALLVCMVIASMFAEVLFRLPLQWLSGFLFISSTLALTVGLASFLREVHLATGTVRIPLSLPEPD